ncbi:GIY-YIG nuclease family protein [Pseudoroseicyclus sp. H15]
MELYFIDGDPNGMLTAEVFNWTGHILMAPRTRIREALTRREASYSGVYLLIGEDEGRTKIYIGESDNIARRIGQHDVAKDWWTSAVIIVSAANTLHKAHAAYLESRLVEIASDVGRYDVDNRNAPSRASLPEAAVANMEAFLENILMVLPALRIDGFLSRKRRSKEIADERLPGDPEFEMGQKSTGINARALLSDGEFVVLAGSQARHEWVGIPSGYQTLYAELVDQGVLGPQTGDKRLFLDNYAFSSPSAAAAVILGRAANGTTEWKAKGTSQTYKAWEAAQLIAEVAE